MYQNCSSTISECDTVVDEQKIIYDRYVRGMSALHIHSHDKIYAWKSLHQKISSTKRNTVLCDVT